MISNLDDIIESEQFRRWFLPAAAVIFFVLFVSLGLWQLDRLFEPTMADDRRESLLAGWSRAVSRVRVDD